MKFLNNNLSIDKIHSSRYPHSLGLFYTAITSFLGFDVNDAEYKVMGLAAYGNSRYLTKFLEIVSFSKEKGLTLDMDYFDFSPGALFPYTAKFIEVFGPPAPPSKLYAEKFTSISEVNSDMDLLNYANIACSAQECLTSIVKDIFSAFSKKNHQTPILFSGGVALNTKTNSTILKDNRLLISPDPGDGGSSLGAASAVRYLYTGNLTEFTNPYLGYDLSRDLVPTLLSKFTNLKYKKFESEDSLCQTAVDLISSGHVIGWAQGRSEFGPRALGTRSILADPSKKETQLYVNQAVKFREPFRPFAPAVMEDYISTLFDVQGLDFSYHNSPYYYMLSILPVKKQAYDVIPACIHVDGTCRVQIVSQRSNKLFYNLINKFYLQSGVPALLNTSFNLRGEPIVNTSKDAISTFSKSGMHSLFLNDFLISKI